VSGDAKAEDWSDTRSTWAFFDATGHYMNSPSRPGMQVELYSQNRPAAKRHQSAGEWKYRQSRPIAQQITASFTVFVCSTFSDLSQEREGVLDAIRLLKLQHDSMEFFGSAHGAAY
jgi:hypothetical protein